MLVPIAFILIAIGLVLLLRARALLHWRRGARDLSSWQRRWLVKGPHVLRVRAYGLAILAVGIILLSAAPQMHAPMQMALNFARP